MPSKSQGRFLRPLGASERIYWLYDQVACTNFSIIAEIDRRIEPESLISAIFKVIQRSSAHHKLRYK
jgi:hypothetical protein